MAITASARSATNSFRHELDLNGRHTIVVDEPADKGGADSGPTPRELLPAALASCIAITLRLYAERKGWSLRGLEVHVAMDDEVRPPRYGVAVELPAHLDEDQRERLMRVAGKCPVHRLLAEGAVVNQHELERQRAAA